MNHGQIGKSTAMRQLLDLARRVAMVDSTILITGERGTGKRRIARRVHDGSARATAPFIAIRCGAVAETLLRSELFGHARDAFPGASQDRPGLFEDADGGTLVLEEVGDLPLGMQSELLSTLTEKRVRRLGDAASRPFDVRVVVAAASDLQAQVAAGTFRLDLLNHLKAMALHVPSLRERRADLLPLARAFLADATQDPGRNVVGFAPTVAEQFLRYDWPGNVCELENVLERAVAVARGPRVEVEDLPPEIRFAVPNTATSQATVRPLDDVEKDYILAALQLNGGNQKHTAEQLRIGSATLYRKLKSYGLIAGKRTPDSTSSRERS